MHKKQWSCLFFFFLITVLYNSELTAQTCRYTLTGVIKYAGTKKANAGLTVMVKPGNFTSTTDSLGAYTITQLCRQQYTVEVYKKNVLLQQRSVNMAGMVTLNFEMVDEETSLDEVIVNAKRDANINTIKQTVSEKDINQTRGQTLGEVLQRVNGVTVLQTGSTIFKPVIHGLHSQRILILNNGVRQEGQQWGSEHAPEIDPFTADKFTVLKGAGALKYGSDAIGGAVLVEPKALPETPGTTGEINSAYFDNNRMYVLSGMVQQNLKKIPALSWRLQATYKRGGNSRTPDYWLWNTGVKEFNYAASVIYRKQRFTTELFLSAFNTDLGIFIGSHIGNLTDLQTAIQSKKPTQNIDAFSYEIGRPRQEVSHFLLKSKTMYKLSEWYKLNIILSRQENIRQEYDRAIITNRPELDLNIGTTILDISVEQNEGKPSQTQLGVTGTLQENVWSGSRFFIPNFKSTNLSAYAIRKWNTQAWLLETGLRYDYKTLTTFRNQNNQTRSLEQNFNNISASVGATYKINRDLRLLMNAAMAWRAPQVNELFVNGLHHGSASFEIGDSTLKSEKAYNFSAQLKYEPDSSWNIDIGVYYNLIDDFINLVPSVPPTLTLRGAYPTFRYIQTNALLAGTDISVQKIFNQHWTGGVKAAILFARDRVKNDWLLQMPANRFEYDLTYNFSTRQMRNSYVQLKWIQVLEQTRVPTGFTDYLPPPPAYNLLNIEFATTLQIYNKSTTFGLSVLNSLNTQYRDYMNRFRYFNDEVGRSLVLRVKIPL
jgi:iron complex outermembrane receptor protein